MGALRKEEKVRLFKDGIRKLCSLVERENYCGLMYMNVYNTLGASTCECEMERLCHLY